MVNSVPGLLIRESILQRKRNNTGTTITEVNILMIINTTNRTLNIPNPAKVKRRKVPRFIK